MELTLKNTEELINTYAIKDKGSYYVCRCPVCDQNEAFMYKDNMNYINCSRKNECGERTHIIFEEQSQNKVNVKEQDNSVSKEERVNQKILTDFFDYIQINDDSYKVKDNFRGLSQESCDAINLLKLPPALDKFMKTKTKSIYEDFHKILQWNHYDRIILLRNENSNKVDRIFFRSTHPKEGIAKVVQKKLVSNAQSFMTYNLDANKIYFAESPIDAASLIEVDKAAGFISSTTANISRDQLDFIQKNAMAFIDKEIVLAFDNDEAGKKADEKIRSVFKTYQIEPKTLDMLQYKDPNEVLQDNRENLIKIIDGKGALIVAHINDIDYRNLINNNGKLMYMNSTTGEPMSFTTDNENVNKFLNKEISDKDLTVLKNEIKLDEATERINNSITNFDSEKGLLEFLNYSKNFPNYSTKNQLILYSQKARLVKSFNEWKKEGVSLRKGSKAVFIFAPYERDLFIDEKGTMRLLKEATPEQKEKIRSGELEFKKITNFKLVPVYDISQTNLEESKYPKYLQQNLPTTSKENNKLVLDLAKTFGVTIREDNLQSVRGNINVNEKIVTLNEFNTPSQNTATLLHELGHLVAFAEYKKMGYVPNESIRELHAEGIGYLVADKLDIDLTERSTKYISGWTNDNPKKIINNLDFIKKGAHILNTRIDKLQEHSLILEKEQYELKEKAEKEKLEPKVEVEPKVADIAPSTPN